MQGVTTALVGFIFVCVIYPHFVKNRPQFYAAFAAVCLIILLDAFSLAIHPTDFAGFRVFAYAACAFLQVAAMILLFLSAGGLTLRELAEDMASAYEVIRRGGNEKTVIIPLSAEMQAMKARRQAEAAEAARAAKRKHESAGPIELEDPEIHPE